MSMDPWLDWLGGAWCSRTEIMYVGVPGLACLKGEVQRSGDPVCLWISGLTALRGGAVQQNGDHACVGPWLGRP
jgi:hypothetical protein